ncbi:MAG: ribonuclease III family protein [Methanoculleaceae archaeon]
MVDSVNRRSAALDDLFDRFGIPHDSRSDRLYALAEIALTHRSYANEAAARGEALQDNERLEFLGNYVLDFLIAELLYHIFPESEPGELNRRISITQNRNLAGIVRRRIPELDGLLRLGRGQGVTDSIRADALEALIGAVYLAGGIRLARRMVTGIFGEEIRRHRTGRNYKGRLQEAVLARGVQPPRYDLRRIGGTNDRPVWRAEAVVAGEVCGTGEGRSRREAEQRAAREALRRFGDGR